MSAEPHAEPAILLVEDNEMVRHAFAILLEESGYRVSQAGSGSEALEVSTREAPDLILMDLGLPDMSGLEVTRRLKAQEGTRNIVVVALTGRDLESDKSACRDAGCAGYFVKPVDTRQLLRDLPGYLESRP